MLIPDRSDQHVAIIQHREVRTLPHRARPHVLRGMPIVHAQRMQVLPLPQSVERYSGAIPPVSRMPAPINWYQPSCSRHTLVVATLDEIRTRRWLGNDWIVWILTPCEEIVTARRDARPLA